MLLVTLYRSIFILSTLLWVIAFGEQKHECNRHCVTGASLKCRYNFIITEVDIANTICEKQNDGENNCIDQSINRVFYINNETPGPTIEVCLGDTIEVFVHNKLSSQEVSLHWHGVRQIGTPHMDGVPMVSQCPILPYSSFRYDIKPDQNGTYFYHAHIIGQQRDGLFGALIVHSPDDDNTMEKLLIMSAGSSSSSSGFPYTQLLKPIDLKLNGKVSDVELKVEKSSQYLLRLINANIFNCPIVLSVDDHTMEVKAIGDNLVEMSEAAGHAIIFPGERLDIIFTTNEIIGRYRMTLRGLHDCESLVHEATVSYVGTKSDSEVKINSLFDLDIAENLRVHTCHDLKKNVLCSMNLKSKDKWNSVQKSFATYYIPFDMNYYNEITDEMTRYQFEIYDSIYYPSYLTTDKNGVIIAQINKMSFKYPPSPILSQPAAVPEDIKCSLEYRAENCNNSPHFCECLQILPIAPRSHVEIILIDEGHGGNVSHVFHVHGYSASVIGFRQFERPITRKEIISLDSQGLLPRNILNPPKMDTFVVPNKGYIILRFHTDNLGYWLWEARSSSTFSSDNAPAMQFLMRVGNPETLPTVPIDFPTCGNHKGPDLIFEDE